MTSHAQAVRAQDPPHPASPPRAAGAAVVLAALGVVFGDIGTSPLYALQTVFSIDHHVVTPNAANVYGVVSLMFWSITLVVSVKYVGVVMRADNDGEGGVMALAALARRLYADRPGRTALLLGLGIIGLSLFYGDSLITPAISVLSAVEGLGVAAPGLKDVVLPASVVILTCLFLVQRFGTGKVGRLFGPVTALWLLAIAAAGVHQVVLHPGVLQGLSPTYAWSFVVRHPAMAFAALGAVVLVITGAEALYADMGHFGRPAILRAWLFLVFPALTLNYLGQAALVLHDAKAVSNPSFLLVPAWGRWPMVVLATLATVIASQAVISGAFSLSRQAMQLGLLPPVRVRQTSRHEGGQIYLPGVNAALFAGVLVLMLAFRSSARLATAYGVSVTGALLVDTILLLLVARVLWHWSAVQLTIAAVAFGGTEAAFLTANLSKIARGGWLPLLIAGVLFVVMTTWRRGRDIVAANRRRSEGSLREFVEGEARGLPRVAGTAVFPHPSKDTTPLALRANTRYNHVLHERVLIVSAVPENVPVVPVDGRFAVDELGLDDDGIAHLTVHYGFGEPLALADVVQHAIASGAIPGFTPSETTFFLSRGPIRRTREPGLARWRKALFVAMAHNAADPAAFFQLPRECTVTMGTEVEI